jgi:hypothetical protein
MAQAGSEQEDQMEPDQDRIKSISDTTGASEAEALVMHHITATEQALEQLPGEEIPPMQRTLWSSHTRSLMDSMLARIARRDHPEGWNEVPPG